MKINLIYLFVILLLGGCTLESSITDMENEITHFPFKSTEDERWGLIGLDGTVLIENEFQEEPSPVINGMFHVKNENNNYEIYVADKSLKRVGNEYLSVGNFSSGLAPVVEKGQFVKYINQSGKTIFELKEYKGETIIAATEFQNDKAVFKTSSNHYGFIDTKGKVILPPIYDYASLFYGEYAIVKKEDKISLITEKGEEVIGFDNHIICQLLPSEGVFPFVNEEEDACGYMNLKGEKVIKENKRFKRGLNFINGHAVFYNSNNEVGLIDKKGNIVIRAKYQNLIQCEDILIFKDNDKEGLLDYEGNVILKAEYKDIIPFVKNNKFTYALDDDVWVLIDKEGREVNNNSYDKISYPHSLLLQFRGRVDDWGYYEDWYESDYIDLDAEAERISLLIKNEGVDKVPYGVTPKMFANIYEKDYQVSDLKGKQNLDQVIICKDNYEVALFACYNANVIVPRYEQKWKENYWGYGGYYEKVLGGYDYNKVQAETFMLAVIAKGKLKEREKELHEAIYRILEKRFGPKTGERDSEKDYSVFFKKDDFSIGLHWNKEEKYSVIVVGMNN